MSGRRSKKNQKLGSSRRGTRGLKVNEDKDNDDGQDEVHTNTENQTEATVSQTQFAEHLPSLNIDRLTPVLESSPDALIHKDLEAEAEVPERKRKIGSTRKNTGGRKLKPCDEVRTTEEFGEEQVTQLNASAIEEEHISFIEDERSNPHDVPMGQPIPHYGDVTATEGGQETPLASNSGQKRKMGSTRKPRGGNRGWENVEVQDLISNETGDVWKAEVKSSSEAEYGMLTEMMQTWDDVKRRDSPANKTNHTESAFVSSESLSYERAKEPEALAGTETTNLSVTFSVVNPTKPASETSSHHEESFLNSSSDTNNHTEELKVCQNVTVSPPTQSDSFALNADFTDFNISYHDLRHDTYTSKDCNSVKLGEVEEEPCGNSSNISSSKQDELDKLVVIDKEPLSSSCTLGGAPNDDNCEIFTDVLTAEDSKVSDTPTVTDSTAEMSNTPPDIYSLEDEEFIRSNILGQRMEMEEESTRLQMKHIEENFNMEATKERTEIQSEMQQGEMSAFSADFNLANLPPVSRDLHNSNIKLSSLLPEDGILSCNVMAEIVISNNPTINSEESSASFPEVENVRESQEICVEMKEEKAVNDVVETSVTFDVSVTEIVTNVEDFTELAVDQTLAAKIRPETDAFEMIDQDNVKDNNTEQIFTDAKDVEEERDTMTEMVMDAEDFTEQGVDLQTLATREIESVGAKTSPETDAFEMIDQDIIKDDVKDDNMLQNFIDAEDNEGEEGGTTQSCEVSTQQEIEQQQMFTSDASQIQVDPSQDDAERIENTTEVLEDVGFLLPDEGSYVIQGIFEKKAEKEILLYAKSEGPAFNKDDESSKLYKVIEEFKETGEHENIDGSPVASLDVAEPLENVQDEDKKHSSDINLEEFHVSESAEIISGSSLKSNTVQEQADINIIPEDSHGDNINPIVYRQEMSLSVNKEAGLVVVLGSALMPSSCSSDIVSEESTEERTCDITESETPIKFHEESQENAGHVVPVEGDTEPRLEIQTAIMLDSTVVEEETEKINLEFNVLVREVEFVVDKETIESNETAKSDFAQSNTSDTCKEVLEASENVEDVSAVTDTFDLQDVVLADSEEINTGSEKTEIFINPDDSQADEDKDRADERVTEEATGLDSDSQEEKNVIDHNILQTIVYVRDNKEHEMAESSVQDLCDDAAEKCYGDDTSKYEQKSLRNISDTQDDPPQTDSDNWLESEWEVVEVRDGETEDTAVYDEATKSEEILTVEDMNSTVTVTSVTHQHSEEEETSLSTNTENAAFVRTDETSDESKDIEDFTERKEAELLTNVDIKDNDSQLDLQRVLTEEENYTTLQMNLDKLQVTEHAENVSTVTESGLSYGDISGQSHTVHENITEIPEDSQKEEIQSELIPFVHKRKMGSTRRPLRGNKGQRKNREQYDEIETLHSESLIDEDKEQEKNISVDAAPLEVLDSALMPSSCTSDLVSEESIEERICDITQLQTPIKCHAESQENAGDVEREPIDKEKEKDVMKKEEKTNEDKTEPHSEIQEQKNDVDPMTQKMIDVAYNKEEETPETVKVAEEKLSEHLFKNKEWHGEITSEQEQKSLSVLSQTQDDPPQVDTERMLENESEAGEEKDRETKNTAVNYEDIRSEEILSPEHMNSKVTDTSATHQQSEEEETSHSANTEHTAFDRTNETSDESKDFRETECSVNVQDNDSQPDLQTENPENNKVLTKEENDTTPNINPEELQVTEHAENISSVTETDLSYGDAVTVVSGESLTVQENITEIPEDSQKEEIQSKLNPLVNKRKMGSTRRPMRGNKGQRKIREQYDESETLNSESLIDEEKEQEREISVEKDAALVEVLDSDLMPSSCSSDLVSEESTEERICDITQSQTPIKCHTGSQENAGDIEGEQLDQETEPHIEIQTQIKMLDSSTTEGEGTEESTFEVNVVNRQVEFVGDTVTVHSSMTIESDFLQNDTFDTNKESFEASENVENVPALNDAGLLQEIKKGLHLETQDQNNVTDHNKMQNIINVRENEEHEIAEMVSRSTQELCGYAADKEKLHGDITCEQQQMSSSNLSQTQDNLPQVDTVMMLESKREVGEERERETEDTSVNYEATKSEEILTLENMTLTIPVTSVTHQHSEKEETSLSVNTENAAFDRMNETSDESKEIEDFTERKEAEHLTNVNIQDNDSQPDLHTVLTEEENDTTPQLKELHKTEHAESVSTVTESGLTYGDILGEPHTVHENITEIPEDSQKEEIQSELNPIVHMRKMGSTRRPLRGNKGQRKNREQYDESETHNRESLISDVTKQEREISVEKDAAIVEVLDSALRPSSCSSDLVSEESTAERICDITQSQTPIKCHAEPQENAGDVEGEPIEQDTEAIVGATVTLQSKMIIESDFLHNNPLDTNEEVLKGFDNVEGVSAVTDAGRLLQNVDSEKTDTVPEKTKISINPEDSQGEDSQSNLSPVFHKRKMGSTRRPLRGNKEKGQDVKEKEEKTIENETEPHSENQEQNICVDHMMQKIMDVGYNQEEEISETVSVAEEKLSEHPFENKEWHGEITSEQEQKSSSVISQTQDDPPQVDTERTMESESEAGEMKDGVIENTAVSDDARSTEKILIIEDMNSTVTSVTHQQSEEEDTSHSANTEYKKFEDFTETEVAEHPTNVNVQVYDSEPDVQIENPENNKALKEEENDTTPNINLEELQVTEHAESNSTLTESGLSYRDVVTVVSEESLTVHENITEDSQKEEIQSELNPIVHKRKMGSTRRPLRGNKGQRKNREQYEESESLKSESLIDEEKEQEREISVEKDAAPVEVLDSVLMPSSCSSDLVSEESTEERICDITQSQTSIKCHTGSQENAGDIEGEQLDQDTEPHIEIQTAIKMLDSSAAEGEGTEERIFEVNVVKRQVEFVGDTVTVHGSMTIESDFLQNNTSDTNKESFEASENFESVSALSDAGLLLQDVDSEKTDTVSEKTEISINPEDSQGEDSQSKLTPVVQKRKMGSTRRPLKGNKEKIKSGKEIKKEGSKEVSEEDTDLHSETQDQNNVTDHNIIQTIINVRENEEHEITETVSRSTQELCGYATDKEKLHGEITSEQQQMSSSNLSQTQDNPPQVDTVMMLESNREVGEERDGETEDTSVNDEDTKSEEILTLENMTLTVPVTSVTHQHSEKEETSLSVNTENAAFDRMNETSDESKEIEDFTERKEAEHLTSVNIQDNDSQLDLQTVFTEEENDTTPHMPLEELHKTEHAESVSTVTESGLSYGDISGESHTVHENITKIPEDSQKEEIQSELNTIVHKRKMGSTRRPLRGNKGQRKNREQYEESETLNSESLIDEEKEQDKEIRVEKDARPFEVLDSALMLSSCSSDLVSEESTAERICDITQSQTPIKLYAESQENVGDVEGDQLDQDIETTVTMQSNITIESDLLQNNTSDTNKESFDAPENVESVSALTDAGLLLHVDLGETSRSSEKTKISINPEDSQEEDSQSKLSPLIPKRKMGSTRRPLRGNKEKGQVVKEKEEKTFEDETEPDIENQEQKICVDPMMQKMMDVGYNKEEETPETVSVAEEKLTENPFENKEWHGEITSEQEQSSSIISQTQDDPPQVNTERTMESESEAGEMKDGVIENTAVSDDARSTEKILIIEDMNSTVTSVTHQQSGEEETSHSANTEYKKFEDFTETEVAEHPTNFDVQDNDSEPDLQTENPENKKGFTEEENDTTPNINLEELLKVNEDAASVTTVTESDLSYRDVDTVLSEESLTVHEKITEIPEDSQKEENLNPIVHKRKMGSTRRPLRGNKGQRKNREQYEESESFNNESLINEEKEQERDICLEKDAAPLELSNSALMASSCSSDLVSEESTEEKICDITQSQTLMKVHADTQEREPIEQDTEAIVGATVTMESYMTIESDFLHDNTNQETLKASENVESVSAVTDAGLLLQDVDSGEKTRVSEKTEIRINPEDSQGEDSQLKPSPVVHKRKMGSTRRPLRGNKEKGQDVKEKEEKINEEETEPHSKIQEQNIFVDPMMPKMLDVGYNKEEISETNDQTNQTEETGVEEGLTNVNAQDNDSQSDLQSENPEKHILQAEKDTHAHLEIQTEIKMFDSAIVGREGTEESFRDVNDPMRQVEFVDINQQEFEASKNFESVSPVSDAGLQKDVGSEETNPEDSQLKLNPVVHKRKMGSTRRPLRGKTEKEEDGEGKAYEEDTKPHSDIQEQNNVVDQKLMNVEHIVLTEEENDTTPHTNLEEVQETEHAESISTLTTCGFSYGDVVTGESQTVQENITEIPDDSQIEEISKLNPLVQKRKMGSTRKPLRGNKGQRKNREQYDESETLNSESLISDETEQEREISVEKDAALVEVLGSVLMPSSCSSDLVSEESTAERIYDITQSQTLHADTQDNTGNVESLPAERDTNAHLEFQTEIKIFDSAIVGREGTEMNICDVNVLMRQVEFVTSENVESVSAVSDAGLQKDVGSEETNTISLKTEIGINPEDTQRGDSQSKLTPVVQKRKMGSTRRPLRGNKEKEDFQEKDEEEQANKEDREPHSEIQDQNNVVNQKMKNVEHNEDKETSETVKMAGQEISENPSENKEWHREITLEQEQTQTGPSQDDAYQNLPEIQEKRSDVLPMEENQLHILSRPVVLVESPQIEDGEIHSVSSSSMQKRRMGSTRKTLRGKKTENEREVGNENNGETQNVQTDDGATKSEEKFTLEEATSLTITRTYVCHQQPFNSTPKQGRNIQDNEGELDKQTENPEENEGSEERSENSYTNPEPLNVPECADPTRPTEPETVTTEKRRKMGSTRKNFRGKREVKREESEGTDPAGSHVQILFAPRDDQNSDQIIHSPEHSESSLLSEIERALNQTSQCSQNLDYQLIIDDPNSHLNTSETLKPEHGPDKDSLQVTQSQRPESPSELGSPGRRRKMGSTRKSPRQQLQVKREDEEMAEDLDKNKQEPKVLKKDLEAAEESKVCDTEDQEGNKECLDVPIGLKTSCQLEESAKSGIQESTSPSTKRKFGSRRTNMAKKDFGELNPSECEKEECNSDDIMIKKAGQTGSSPGQKQAVDLKNRTAQDMEMVQFNVVMVGDSCVGKTSFVRRFHKGYFTPDYSSTIGVDICVQNVVLDERVVKLHIWDTAGQERFHSITTQVFHRANGLLLMYDITSSKSFMSVRNWITQVQEKAPDDVVMMLLGNKNDSVEHEREVQVQEGEDLAREYKIHFMECSAATGDNVSECMKSLAELLVQRKRQKVEKHTALKKEQPQKKSGCC